MIAIVIVDGSQARSQQVPASELNISNWKECVVPAMIGVPLKVKKIRECKTREGETEVGIFLMIEPKSGIAFYE